MSGKTGCWQRFALAMPGTFIELLTDGHTSAARGTRYQIPNLRVKGLFCYPLDSGPTSARSQPQGRRYATK